MKKTKIKFEDIKAGDLLEVVVIDGGTKSVITGIAFKLEEINSGWQDAHTFWSTSEGSMIAAKGEESATLYRIDVRETKFDDIREGDKLRVTTTQGDRTVVVESVAHQLVGPDFNKFWIDEYALPIVYKQVYSDMTCTIEILERAGE